MASLLQMPPRSPKNQVSMPWTPWFVALCIVMCGLLVLRLFL